MRNLLASVVLALAVPVTAAASPAEVVDCLNAVDVPCAEAVLARHDLARSTDADLLYLAARTRFFAGRYDEAYDLMARAVEAGFADRWDELPLYDRTRTVARDFVEEVRQDRYVVRYRPGLDAVLIEEVFSAMERSEASLSPLLGGRPPGRVTVEVFPTGRTFTEASSLTEKDVKTTGVVALSKWSRLLLTSPRALGRGYDWQDTIAHEYVHQVVSHLTHERSPVWLQEAIAKYLDNRWRDGGDRFHLDPRSESLLAKAVADNDLVPFEMMHPSLAKLPTADKAALAYAQLASLMQFVFIQAGEDVLPGVLADVDNLVDPRVALAKGAGFSSFASLEAAWKGWVVTQGLRKLEVADLKPQMDAAADDDLSTDPVLSARKDLARFQRLGKLLAERGHHEAALIEYRKADAEVGRTSPLLQTRIAESQAALGNVDGARSQLAHTLELYPDFTLAWRALGYLEQASGRRTEALAAFARTVELDPFDADVHALLVQLYGGVGQTALSRRHAEQLEILQRGGQG